MSVHGTRHRNPCNSGPDVTRNEEIQDQVQTILCRIEWSSSPLLVQSSEHRPKAIWSPTEDQLQTCPPHAYQKCLHCRPERAHRHVGQSKQTMLAAKKVQQPRRTPVRCQQVKLSCVLPDKEIMCFVNLAHPTQMTAFCVEAPQRIKQVSAS